MPNGIFVLADIGGYTTFLTDVGIEHAKEITLVTTPLAGGMAEASGLDATPGRDEYGDVGAVDYVYMDFRGVREAYKSREIYLTEDDADVAVSISGTVEQVGSVHTCLHGDAGKMVHFRVAYDGKGRRFTGTASRTCTERWSTSGMR
jgi:hypothetical protein